MEGRFSDCVSVWLDSLTSALGWIGGYLDGWFVGMISCVVERSGGWVFSILGGLLFEIFGSLVGCWLVGALFGLSGGCLVGWLVWWLLTRLVVVLLVGRVRC